MVDRQLREKIELFLLPLYLDLDGVSRFDEALRIERIARSIHEPRENPAEEAFEYLLLFHLLGSWPEKLGNRSRLLLALPEVSESALDTAMGSIRRLQKPETCCERAVAAAVLIDRAGVRGLAERLGRARREGLSVLEVAGEDAAVQEAPAWMSETARELYDLRQKRRAEFCRAILDEG